MPFNMPKPATEAKARKCLAATKANDGKQAESPPELPPNVKLRGAPFTGD